MEKSDVEGVGRVHASVFSRQTGSAEWVSANFRAFPRIQYFVAEEEREVLGYIQWIEKAGFRKEAVIELEQIGVLPDRQGEGIGSTLIVESLKAVTDGLAHRGSALKSILVTTRTDNEAQRLYVRTLEARRVAVIEQLYSADEAVLLATAPFGQA